MCRAGEHALEHPRRLFRARQLALDELQLLLPLSALTFLKASLG